MQDLKYLAARMLLDLGINAAMKTKTDSNDALSVKFLQLHCPISTVEVKNVGSCENSNEI